MQPVIKKPKQGKARLTNEGEGMARLKQVVCQGSYEKKGNEAARTNARNSDNIAKDPNDENLTTGFINQPGRHR